MWRQSLVNTMQWKSAIWTFIAPKNFQEFLLDLNGFGRPIESLTKSPEIS